MDGWMHAYMYVCIYLCQSIEINNNKHVYRQSQVQKPKAVKSSGLNAHSS